MSKKREIDQLISEAVLQGFEFDYQPSGHWKATNPSTRKHIRISSTPKSDRGVTDARVRLTRIGFTPKRPPKKKERKPTTTKVVKETKDTLMPKLGEMATIKTAVPTDEVQNNIPMAAYVLWEALHIRMKASSKLKYEDRSKSLADLPGKVWEGSRDRFMEDMWPGIPRQVKNRVGKYLTGSRNMATLVRGRGDMLSVWWVSDEFTEVTEYKAKYARSDWWEDTKKATFIEPKTVEKTKDKKTYDRGKFTKIEPDETGYFRCDQCNFATKSMTSFQPHIGKLGDKPHPDEGVFECRFCDDILPTANQLKHHQNRRHRDTGLFYCEKCLDYVGGDAYKHRQVHFAKKSLDNLAENEAKQPAPPVETAPDAELDSTSYVVVPTQKANGDLVDAEKALQAILDELGLLRVRNMELQAENSALIKENGELKAALEPLRTLFNK